MSLVDVKTLGIPLFVSVMIHIVTHGCTLKVMRARAVLACPVVTILISIYTCSEAMMEHHTTLRLKCITCN